MNATVMAKPFSGKKVNNFLRNKSTIEFINAIQVEKDESLISDACESPLVEVIIGKGKPQGTWLHEELALELAQWLNPKFKIWCNHRIKEIIIKGFSA